MPSQTRQFVEDLANLLKEAGFNIDGPKAATVYLAVDSFAIEWGYSEKQLNEISALFNVLFPIIKMGPRHAKRKTFREGRMRIHFGGQVIFNPDSSVSIK